MSKSRYTGEFKKRVIEEYNSGIGGYKLLAKKHSMSPKTVKNWVINSNKAVKEVAETNTIEEKTKSVMPRFMFFKEQFSRLECGEKVEIHLPIKHYWTAQILKLASKADENNSNVIQVWQQHTKETLLAKITEIKATIKDDIKEFMIVFELFNDK